MNMKSKWSFNLTVVYINIKEENFYKKSVCLFENFTDKIEDYFKFYKIKIKLFISCSFINFIQESI